MDRTMRINAIIRFIETHIKEDIDYHALEQAVALSYRQLREDFKNYGKKTAETIYRITKNCLYCL